MIKDNDIAALEQFKTVQGKKLSLAAFKGALAKLDWFVSAWSVSANMLEPYYSTQWHLQSSKLKTNHLTVYFRVGI